VVGQNDPPPDDGDVGLDGHHVSRLHRQIVGTVVGIDSRGRRPSRALLGAGAYVVAIVATGRESDLRAGPLRDAPCRRGSDGADGGQHGVVADRSARLGGLSRQCRGRLPLNVGGGAAGSNPPSATTQDSPTEQPGLYCASALSMERRSTGSSDFGGGARRYENRVTDRSVDDTRLDRASVECQPPDNRHPSVEWTAC